MILIYTNIAALNAYGNYSNNVSLFQKSLLRISTGLRINSASDDPSGFAIADKLRTQASSIKQGIQNANSAVALIQIADKAMSEQSRILDTVKSKLIQAKTDTTSTQGKEAIRKDINKLLTQLDNIASQTNYNSITLLQKNSTNDTPSDSLKFHVGENFENTISTNGNIQANTAGLDIDSLKNIAYLNSTNTGVWMEKVDNALNSLNLFRSDFGSTQNQLESSVRYMTSMHTNLKKSESVIRDVDYAKEVATLSTLRVLMIAGMYAMTQANKVQESMLKLLFK